MKKLVTIISLSIISIISLAQTTDEITLVVNGTAATEEDAKLIALRSAIEQTFGTFVSANTTILNDELIKDEIVNISSGNISNFKILSSIVLDNGEHYVTLEATVSINKLINYSKAKGSTAEFAGQTFAMNIKMMDLREKNTITALNNLVDNMQSIMKGGNLFNYKLTIGQVLEGCAKIYHYQKTYKFDDDGYIDIYQFEKDIMGYRLPIQLSYLASPITTEVFNLFENTLQSLSLSPAEIEEYRAINHSFYIWGNKWYLPVKNEEEVIACQNRLFLTLTSELLSIQLKQNNSSTSYLWMDLSENPSKSLYIPYNYFLSEDGTISHGFSTWTFGLVKWPNIQWYGDIAWVGPKIDKTFNIHKSKVGSLYPPEDKLQISINSRDMLFGDRWELWELPKVINKADDNINKNITSTPPKASLGSTLRNELRAAIGLPDKKNTKNKNIGTNEVSEQIACKEEKENYDYNAEQPIYTINLDLFLTPEEIATFEGLTIEHLKM